MEYCLQLTCPDLARGASAAPSTLPSPVFSFDILTANSPPGQWVCRLNGHTLDYKWMKITHATAPTKKTWKSGVATSPSKKWMKRRIRNCVRALTIGAPSLTPRPYGGLGTNSTSMKLRQRRSKLWPVHQLTQQKWMPATCQLLYLCLPQCSPLGIQGMLEMPSTPADPSLWQCDPTGL